MAAISGLGSEQKFPTPPPEEQNTQDAVEHSVSFPILKPEVANRLKADQFYRVFEQDEEVEKVRCCANGEVFAQRAKFNPAFISAMSGLGPFLGFKQFFRLWPKEELQPALSLISSSTCLVGFFFGTLYLSHEKTKRTFTCLKCKPENASANLERILSAWMAFISAIGLVFPATLQPIITGFCTEASNWDNNVCVVSNNKFLLLSIPPFVISSGYFVWHSLSPSGLESCASKSKVREISVKVTEVFFKGLFFTGIFHGLMEALALCVPAIQSVSTVSTPLYLQIPAGIGAVGAMATQTLKPHHRQKVDTTMAYGYVFAAAIQLAIYLSDQFKKDQRTDSSLAFAIIPLVTFIASVIFGTTLTLLWSRDTVKEIERVSRLRPVGDRNQVLSLRTQAEQEAQAKDAADRESQTGEMLLAANEDEKKVEDHQTVQPAVQPKELPADLKKSLADIYTSRRSVKKSRCPDCRIL